MAPFKNKKIFIDDEAFEKQLLLSIKKIPWEMKKVKVYLWLLKKFSFIRVFSKKFR